AEVQRYKFFGAYVDLCHPEACRFFLETTYKRYLEAFGAERFARLAGFFVDEAHPQNWSWCLPDAFRRRCGYDLYQALPALWTDTGPQTAQVRYDYHQCITELFVDSFHRPLAEWCREHGVRLSLEVGSTRNLVQRHADIPGIDPGHHKVGVPLDEILDRELPSFRGNLNFPASLAAQTGRTRVLDELFHSVGWSMTLQDMKGMIDRAAARGANLFACHGFCYTIGGLKKWDAPPSEFDQNPYWPHFPLLADYAGRLAYALSRGRRVAPVALLDPITSLWVHGEGTGGSATSRDEVARRLAGDWVYLMRELVAAQRPHDNLDPLLLAEAEVEDGALRLGDATYRVVVLPPVTTLERAAWDKLEAFARAGGTVIACGLLPYETIEPHQDVVARCGAAFGADPLSLRQAYEEEGPAGLEVARRGPFALLRTTGTLARAGAAPALLDLLEELVPLQLRLTPDAGAPARRHFLLAQRGHDDQQLFFVANSSMEEHQCEVALRVQEGRPAIVTRLDLESGTTEALPVSWEPGAAEQRLRLRFPRHGAHLLLVTPTQGATSHTAPAEHPGPSPVPLPASVELDLRGEWRCTPEGANVLRLDRFRFTTTHDQPGAGASEPPHPGALPHAPLVEPKPLINVLQDLEQAQQPWPTPVQVVPVFGAPPVLQLKLPATAWYEATFMVHHAPGRVTLCLED
ncbi:MAG TPA: glycosyl hydrolase, partial [Chloroflexota bacterium]|nr:glycosyl hydrolase [Chloroflexota bacterium]